MIPDYIMYDYQVSPVENPVLNEYTGTQYCSLPQINLLASYCTVILKTLITMSIPFPSSQGM